jgi:hypothetical protein
VAICSFAIDVRSSWLVAADRLVNGVLTALPPLVEPVGVDEAESSTPLALTLAACLAAFSASRFCFEADGGIAVRERERREEKKKAIESIDLIPSNP